MFKKQIALFAFALIFILMPAAAQADALWPAPDMDAFKELFGESGLDSIHIDDFHFDGIDFDVILEVMSGDRANYSALNYDAFLDLFQDPEILADLGIKAFDRKALKTWLQDRSVKETVCSWMVKVREGGSLSECVLSLNENMDFLESFSAITGGSDFDKVVKNLDSDKAADFLNRAASALLSTKSGTQSETAVLISDLVQAASDTLEGEY